MACICAPRLSLPADMAVLRCVLQQDDVQIRHAHKKGTLIGHLGCGGAPSTTWRAKNHIK